MQFEEVCMICNEGDMKSEIRREILIGLKFSMNHWKVLAMEVQASLIVIEHELKAILQ